MAFDPAARPSSPRLVFGLAVMAWGVLLTLDNFGVLDASRFWRFWPTILIAIGVVRLGESFRGGGRASGGFLVLLGVALLLANLGLLHFRHVWPMLIVVAGAGIVWRAMWRPSEDGRSSTESGERVEAFTMLGGIHKGSSNHDFRGGSATAVLGGCEIDLRRASIVNGPAVFDAFAMWGAVVLFVPDDWTVESRLVPFLGGFEDKTRPPAEAKKRLIVTGMAIMGGVEVKN